MSNEDEGFENYTMSLFGKSFDMYLLLLHSSSNFPQNSQRSLDIV